MRILDSRRLLAYPYGMNADIRITVLKRTQNRDALEQYADSIWDPCERFQEGQEFIIKSMEKPDDFICSWAWCDLQKYALTLSRGGNFQGVPEGIFVTCCTDGYRPVIFKLERVS